MTTLISLLRSTICLFLIITCLACQSSGSTSSPSTSSGTSSNGTDTSPTSGNNTPDSSPTNTPNQGGPTNDTPTSIRITAPTQTPQPGDTLQLTTQLNTQSQLMKSLAIQNITFQATNPHIATVTNEGLLEALYPGTIEVTATINGTSSTPLQINIAPLSNSETIKQITDNNVDDSWGMNNTWKTTSRGQVFWVQYDGFSPFGDGLGGNPEQVFIADTQGNILFNERPSTDIDFLALGSGHGKNDIMASWRQNLSDTIITDGQTIVNNGANNQEENTIANGCYYYRDSTNQNDHELALFQLPNSDIAISGSGLRDEMPITSDCQVLWVRGGDLFFFDGLQSHFIAKGPFNFTGEYDLRSGRIVYQKNGDIHLIDTRTSPFTETTLTQDGLTIFDSFPRTDGNSIVWIMDGTDVILHDIKTGQQNLISSTNAVKNGFSLQIDLKQVIWQESNDSFFFHTGTGNNSDTKEILPPSINVNTPYLSDGVIAWFGQTSSNSDTEIFIMD